MASAPDKASAQHGFTLVEVVVVIAVISILAATLAPLLAQQVDQARREATRIHLEAVADALRRYHLDVYDFPAASGDAAADLGQLETNGAGATGWAGPYLTARYEAADYATDAWNGALSYAHTAGTSQALLTAPAADHTLGTADDIQLTVLMDFDAVKRRVDATYEKLKLIAGDVYGTSPTLAPGSYAIPATWQSDAWGNAIVYRYNNDESAVVYSPGPNGTAAASPPAGDDIYVAMLWSPPGGGGGGGSGAGTNDLALGAGSVEICSGNNKVSFRIDNNGSVDLNITRMQITFNDPGNLLEKVEGQSSSASCGNGNRDLWSDGGCGTPDGSQSSPATLTAFCETITVPTGGSYWFTELRFDQDINGKNITVVYTAEPVGGGASATSTITFTAPN
ncbi:MAG: type II secretion system protein GspG [Nitrospirae bacterium]|nr:type II secretion system protein GspG [Nitrospirota bacterium]